MTPHLPGDVTQDIVTILELDAERRVRQHLAYGAFDFDCVFSQPGKSLLLKERRGNLTYAAAGGQPARCVAVDDYIRNR